MRRSRDEITYRRWTTLFIAVTSLLLGEVVWWTTAFMQDVNTVASLKTHNAELLSQLQGKPSSEESTTSIAKEARRRRIMFLSESVTFIILTCIGMYLLFHALRVERRARETQRNFVEIVSHESKTPLTALKLRLESIVEKRATDRQLTKEMGQAMEEVRRLASLFENALSLNRVERGAFQYESLYVADTLRQVVRRMEPLFRSHDVTVSLDLNEDAAVRGDAHGLDMTFQCLLENAVIYNDKAKKEISIRVVVTNANVLIRVQDNGPGIALNERERIFDRFYRGTSSGRIPGTGLGLHLAKTIIETHKGKIRIADISEGCSFEIELPGALVA